jgi:hypothetical protein
MPEIHTAIDVDATPEEVWSVMTDLDAYPEWNPHLVRAEGRLGADERLTLWVRQSGRENRIAVRVTEFDEPRHVEWVGRLGGKFLFEGTHTIRLEPLDGGERTRLHNDESSSGLLVPLVVRKDAREAYEAMNEALRARVEDGRADTRRPVGQADTP